LTANKDDILYFATSTNKGNEKDIASIEEYNKTVSNLKKQIADSRKEVIFGSEGYESYDTDRTKELEKELASYKAINKTIAIQAALFEEADASRKKWFGDLADYFKKGTEYQQYRSQGSKLESGVAKLNTTNEIVYNEGSIAKLNVELAKLKKQYEEAAEDGTRKGFAEAIKKIEERIVRLNLSYKYDNSVMPKMAGIPNLKNTKLPDKIESNKLEPVFTEESVEINNDYYDSLNAISGVMGSITNLTNDGAAAWLS
jgi:hypothetical protein